MTEHFRHIVAKVEKLSEEDQNAIAALIERELLDEQRWDALFADPRSDRALEDLATEALAEAARDETRPLKEIL